MNQISEFYNPYIFLKTDQNQTNQTNPYIFLKTDL